jgi:hypothetical protein
VPLLGAIIPGLISVFRAHARNPSGDRVEHHDDAHTVAIRKSGALVRRMCMTITQSTVTVTTIMWSKRRQWDRARPS